MTVNAKIDLSSSSTAVVFTAASITSMFVGQDLAPETILDQTPFHKSVRIANPPNTPYQVDVFIDGEVVDSGTASPPDIVITPAMGNTVWYVGTVAAIKVTTLTPLPTFPNLDALIANAYTTQSQLDAAFQNAISVRDQWYENVARTPFQVMFAAHLDGFRASIQFSEARVMSDGLPNTLDVPDLFDGNNVVTGSAFGDVIDAGKGSDIVRAGAGDDTVLGGAGPDILDGGEGIDTLSYAGSGTGVTIALNAVGGATVSGGDATGDVVSGFEIVIGSSFNDTLIGNSLANTISGGAGDDTIRAGASADNLDGGEGSDTLSYEFSSGVVVDLKNSTARNGHAEGDTFIGFENVLGSSFDDWFIADANANTFRGGAGSDTVSYEQSDAGVTAVLNPAAPAVASADGDAAGDKLIGIENLVGSNFDDTLIGSSVANRLEGREGNDVVRGGAGADRLDGGPGIDTLSYEGSLSGVVASLFRISDDGVQIVTKGDALGDSVRNFENLTGGNGNDVLSVNDFANTVLGGEGNDLIRARHGGDVLDGGPGSDTLSYQDAFSVPVVVDLAANTAMAAQADTISGFEHLIGSNESDKLYGDDRANSINGGMASDLIEGRGGDDILTGGGNLDGDDTIDGGEGNDRISGGGGNDTVRGAAGRDVLDGGAGSRDAVSYVGSGAGVTITLGIGTLATAGKGGDAEGDVIKGFEDIIGSDFRDVLKASAVGNIISAGGGDDLVVSNPQPMIGPQFDTLDGGDGIDTLSLAGALTTLNIMLDTGTVTATSYSAKIANFEVFIGGSGNDFMFAKFDGSAPVTFVGGAGKDTMRSGGGHDVLDGGSGSDTLMFSGLAAGVSVDLLTNVVVGAGNDTISSFENVNGTSSGDTLRGNGLANKLHGMNGDDVIEGRAGADQLDGGGGINTLSYESSILGVTVSLGANSSVATLGKGGDAEGDAIVNFHNITGGAGNDRLSGNNLDNVLQGRAGADQLDGGGGINTLSYESSILGVTVSLGANSSVATLGKGGDAEGDAIVNFHNITGGAGNDRLSGNNLDNILQGRAGDDWLTGEAGADTFVAGPGVDTITDFSAASKGGADKLDLRAFSAFASFGDLLAAGALSDEDGAATLALAPTTRVVLSGVASADLGQDDFIFAT